VAGDAAQPLDRVGEPGLAAHGEVEAGVAAGDDVEPGSDLVADAAGDGVQVLLAEDRVARDRPEAPASQAGDEPPGGPARRSRIPSGPAGV